MSTSHSVDCPAFSVQMSPEHPLPTVVSRCRCRLHVEICGVNASTSELCCSAVRLDQQDAEAGETYDEVCGSFAS